MGMMFVMFELVFVCDLLNSLFRRTALIQTLLQPRPAAQAANPTLPPHLFPRQQLHLLMMGWYQWESLRCPGGGAAKMQSVLVETWRCRSLRKPGTSALVRDEIICANKKGYTSIKICFPKNHIWQKGTALHKKMFRKTIFYSAINVCCSLKLCVCV